VGALLRELFSERELVGAPGRLPARGGGGIGCTTRQLPTGMALAP
jgi:agmatine/peptidylarginine deiminase